MNRHDTLLLTSRIPENRAQLRRVFQDRYNILEATDTRQTRTLLQQNIDCIAALVLNIPDLQSTSARLLQGMGSDPLLSRVPVIAIVEKDDPEFLDTCFDWGAADVIPLDYEPYAMQCRVDNIVDLHLHRQHLEVMVQEQADILHYTNTRMVDALSSIIEYRSVESGQHILRIRHFTRILLEEVARSCPEYQLTDRLIAIISSASALHDVGKIAIPDSILMKPGPLTPEERKIMQTHSTVGCQILNTLSDVADQEYLRYAYNICHYHHERWDGAGYPEGLAGDDIPICAQVVGLADVYDALTSKRVYKDAYGVEQAVNIILMGECGTFSTRLLECFKNVTRQFADLAHDYADGRSPKTEILDTILPKPEKQEEENSLERVRGKYYALVHYINGFLMEMNLKQQVFHVIYNPYPELVQFSNVTTFEQMEQLILDHVVMPQERERMECFIRKGLPDFMEQDMRRTTEYFRLRSKLWTDGDLYEVTLLRINPMDTSRRSLAVLCRRMETGVVPQPEGSMVRTLAECTFCCRNDAQFTIEALGTESSTLAGYTEEALRNQFAGSFLALVHPEDRQFLREETTRQLRGSTSAAVQFRTVDRDGNIRWNHGRCRLRVAENGREYLYVFLTDISESKREYQALEKALQRYELILSQTENVLFEWNVKEDTIAFSETWETLFGRKPIEGSFREALLSGVLIHPDDLPLLLDVLGYLENGSDYEAVEVRLTNAQGRYVWCRFRASAIRDAERRLEKISGIIINIEAEKQAQRALQDRADRDSLTKLLNKTAGRKHAEEYLGQFPHGASCAMLIIDLDNFKQVNDRYGHLFGDAVLTKVAREIEKLFRVQDIVTRIGGDEFMVLMRGVSDRNILKNRCQRLLNILSALFQGQIKELKMSCSIGIALSPEHGTSYYALFNCADNALYQAKSMGKNNFCFYDPANEGIPEAHREQTAVNAQIDSDVEPGLAEDELVRHAFRKLYTASDPEAAVNDVLALIGEKMNVSRVYIFENTPDNRYCNNTFEWCNKGIRPEKENLQRISYETDIPNYSDNFDEQGIFYAQDIRLLPKHIYDILEPQGIKSLLHCAIREGGVFRGYIGFDECVEQRLWTKSQIRMLTYFSEMLSVYLRKYREEQEASIQTRELHTILNNQNAWIYIIDPETFELEYLNEKIRNVKPHVASGMCCYRALRDLDVPCPGCPARDILQNRSISVMFHNERSGVDTLAEATVIQWKDREACMLTNRKLPRPAEA